MKMEFAAKKINYNFSQEDPEIKNISTPHRVYMQFKNSLIIHEDKTKEVHV